MAKERRWLRKRAKEEEEEEVEVVEVDDADASIASASSLLQDDDADDGCELAAAALESSVVAARRMVVLRARGVSVEREKPSESWISLLRVRAKSERAASDSEREILAKKKKTKTLSHRLFLRLVNQPWSSTRSLSPSRP